MASTQVTYSIWNWPKLSQIRRKSLAHVKVPCDACIHVNQSWKNAGYRCPRSAENHQTALNP